MDGIHPAALDASQRALQQPEPDNSIGAGPSEALLPDLAEPAVLPPTSIPSAEHQIPPSKPETAPEDIARVETGDEMHSLALGAKRPSPISENAPAFAIQRPAYNEPAQVRYVHERVQEHVSHLPAADNELADDEPAEATDDGDDMVEDATETPITTSSEDARHSELIKLQEEIEDLENAIEGLSDYYQIVDRLGEGTFSSVYKAIDRQHFAFDNDDWVNRGPLDPFRKGVCYVALKKIYVTSSPQRIFNELSIMEDLRPAEYVSYLITAFRSEDQIVAVMPYSRHRDFRDYYKEMPLGDFKYYFRCLFSALQSVHEAGIMHRDIKPANFLYDPTTGHGTLCDFGLAERFEPTEWRGKCHHTCPTPEHPHGTKEINRAVDSLWFEPGKPLAGQPPPSDTAASGATSASNGSVSAAGLAATGSGADAVGPSSKSGVMDPPPERVGYLVYDARQGVRANRAGTRGFRAPEVLFKCQDQTVSIDIWSAGVILLTLLIRRFPVFNSNDDVEALLEIAVIFGKSRMETCAMLHNRTFHCNIPTVSNSASLTDFIHRLNPDLRDPGNHPNPEQYLRDVADALDMVKSCLHVDCTRRKTAAELLQHPFLRIEPEDEEEEIMGDDLHGEFAEQEQEFADYYQAGGEYGIEAPHDGQVAQMYEEDELDGADEEEFIRGEEVVQLQSRRGLQDEAPENGEPNQTHIHQGSVGTGPYEQPQQPPQHQIQHQQPHHLPTSVQPHTSALLQHT